MLCEPTIVIFFFLFSFRVFAIYCAALLHRTLQKTAVLLRYVEGLINTHRLQYTNSSLELWETIHLLRNLIAYVIIPYSIAGVPPNKDVNSLLKDHCTCT